MTDAAGARHDHHHHGGHSHGAAMLDPALEASRDGMRALLLSLGLLAVTAATQAVIVALSGSVALLSDTVHNLADALTAVPLGLAFWLGRRPPNARYTYGYGRSEDLAGVAIVVTIAMSAVVSAWAAIDRLLHPRHVHGVGWVMLAGLLGFAGNEVVAVLRIRVGRRIGSAALVADGLHARTDGLTSLAVVIGATAVAAGWRQADAIVGLVITAAVVAVAWRAGYDVYCRLMDAVDPALVPQVAGILASVDGITAVDAVRIRWVGHELHAEVEVTSDAELTLAQAHEVAEHAHHHLLHEVPRLAQATIHTSPTAAPGADPHATTAHHFPKRAR